MYCIKCFKYYAKHKLQNINRCCSKRICKICIKHSNYMCFYCKAHCSRYKQNEELLFDKAYKYKIRKYKYKDIIYLCLWYTDFNCYREINGFARNNLNMNGKVSHLRWLFNGNYHRNYDKPTSIIVGSLFKDKYIDNIVYLVWYQKGICHRGDNKPAYIELHFNGNIRKLEWYYNDDATPYINKLHNFYLNENGDIDSAL